MIVAYVDDLLGLDVEMKDGVVRVSSDAWRRRRAQIWPQQHHTSHRRDAGRVDFETSIGRCHIILRSGTIATVDKRRNEGGGPLHAHTPLGGANPLERS